MAFVHKDCTPGVAGVGVLSYKNDVGARCTFEAFKSVDWYHLGC